MQLPEEDGIEDQDRCEDCRDPVPRAELWTLTRGWADDEKRVCWSCACEAGNYGWRAL